MEELKLMLRELYNDYTGFKALLEKMNNSVSNALIEKEDIMSQEEKRHYKNIQEILNSMMEGYFDPEADLFLGDSIKRLIKIEE